MRKDYLRGALACALLAAFALALASLFRIVVPEGNRDLVTFMLGQLSGLLASGLGFYFNTSKGSADKTDALARMAADPAPTQETEQ